MPSSPDLVERPLTRSERALVESVFGDAIALDPVRIRRRKWWPLQPRNIVMAPCGHIHFHPESRSYHACFGEAGPGAQGLFIHEMTHIWQAQTRGRFYLPLMRHPFCRYAYEHVPGRPFTRYGLEQQAEIVRHALLLRRGHAVAGKPGLPVYEALLPFKGSQPGSASMLSSV